MLKAIPTENNSRENPLTKKHWPAYYTTDGMNGIAKILSPLLLTSFLFSHCEVFSIVAVSIEPPYTIIPVQILSGARQLGKRPSVDIKKVN